MKLIFLLFISGSAFASESEAPQCPASPLSSCNKIANLAKSCEIVRPAICIPRMPHYQNKDDCADVRYDCSEFWNAYMNCAMKVVKKHRPSYNCEENDEIICLSFPHGSEEQDSP